MTLNSIDMALGIATATISAMEVEGHAPEVLAKLEEVSEQLHQAAVYEMNFGEPSEALKRMQTQNTFNELLGAMVKDKNSKNKE